MDGWKRCKDAGTIKGLLSHERKFKFDIGCVVVMVTPVMPLRMSASAVDVYDRERNGKPRSLSSAPPPLPAATKSQSSDKKWHSFLLYFFRLILGRGGGLFVTGLLPVKSLFARRWEKFVDSSDDVVWFWRKYSWRLTLSGFVDGDFSFGGGWGGEIKRRVLKM